jgi:hypothetical protein
MGVGSDAPPRVAGFMPGDPSPVREKGVLLDSCLRYLTSGRLSAILVWKPRMGVLGLLDSVW